MRGEVILHYKSLEFRGGHCVTFSVLGYTDFKNEIKPWCDENLEYPVHFAGTSTVHLVTEEDLALFLLKWR